jgi:hypothetical protein
MAVAGRLAHQALHRGERLGGLSGPTPLAFGCGIGDGPSSRRACAVHSWWSGLV